MADLNIMFVSMHTSPLEAPGARDAGGMNVVEYHQSLALAALGHQVDIVTRRQSEDVPNRHEIAPGVTVWNLRAGPATPLPKSQVDAYIPEFSDALGMLPRPDLIHSHHWMSGVAALPLARRWGVRHVQTFHSVAAPVGSPLSLGEPPESDARLDGEALAARESDAIVSVSTAEARTVVERCGADPTRVSVVAPGVDLELFRPRTEGEERPLAEPYLVFAARLQPLKGADLAIQALAGVPERVRPTLIISGDVSEDYADYRRDLDTMVAEAGLGDRVRFIGPQSHEDLARWLRHSEVCLVPSHSETFGLVALEGAASGVPVMASCAGGLREVVVHGETGLLMMDREPQTWADALTELLEDKALSARLGTIARIHARRFSWEASARVLERSYRAIMRRNIRTR